MRCYFGPPTYPLPQPWLGSRSRTGSSGFVAGSGSGRWLIRPPSIGWFPGQLLERGICSSGLLECLRSSCSTAIPSPIRTIEEQKKERPPPHFCAHMPERVFPLVTSCHLYCPPPGEQERGASKGSALEHKSHPFLLGEMGEEVSCRGWESAKETFAFLCK